MPMSRGAAQNSVSAVRTTLVDGLGDNLKALYLYGSLAAGNYQAGQSDINLLAVIDDGVDLHELRTILKPVWQEFGPVLKKTPLIATTNSLNRHLALNPLLSHHLQTQGELIEGQDLLPGPVETDQLERISRFVTMAIDTSLAVAPSLLSEKRAQEITAKLKSLYRQYWAKPVDNEVTPIELLASVYRGLLSELESYPQFIFDEPGVLSTPPLLDELRAIYTIENRLVLVFPDLKPEAMAERITTINWPAVANRVAEQYRGIQVTTAAELRVMVQMNAPATYYLRSYDHAWGINPLANIPISPWRVYRDLARSPSELLLSTLPHTYISTADADLAMLVHDLQNKLLNIQLRNELLQRIDQVEINLPPIPIPGRDESVRNRIDAIRSHLEWWVDYYSAAMQEALGQLPELAEG
jgi:predicted nucleotidyltransferase